VKACSICKVSKPLSDFLSYPRNKDGVRASCKECNRKPARIAICERCGSERRVRRSGSLPHLCEPCERTHWRCFACKQVKESADFHVSKESRAGRTYRCKDCTASLSASADGVRSRKAAFVKLRYGISLEEYESHLLAVEGTCPCCGKSGRKKMVMDHCHVTGEIRGVICSACNSGIGLLGDDIEGLRKAVAYLERVSG